MRTPWVSFDGKDCSGCKHLNDRGYCEFTACIIPCSVRATIPEVKPQTNGDRIRNMTDEELAEFINDTEYGFIDRPGMCDVCAQHRIQNCCQCWLDWLKQAVEE